MTQARDVTRMSWTEVHHRRLAHSGLLEPRKPGDLAGLVGEVAGIQAQVLSAAELAVGARVHGVTRSELQDQIWAHRTLVKTYGPRGTLHLLPAAELPLWMAAMRGRQNAPGQGWKEYGVDADQGEAIVKAIGTALDGRRLTRDALAEEVSAQVGSWAHEQLTSSWGFLLPPAAYAGLLCYGPSEGTKVTFVRADQWIGGWQDHSERAGLRHVLRRFVNAYGPVSPPDFARWFGLRPDHARDLFAEAGDELVEVDVEGRTAWLTTDAEVSGSDAPQGELRLLPQYDCYVLGSHPRERILPEEARERVFSYRRGRYEGAAALCVVLVDGIVSGIWERRSRGRRTEIQVEPFVPLDEHLGDQLDRQAMAIGEFLDSEVTLTVGRLD